MDEPTKPKAVKAAPPTPEAALQAAVGVVVTAARAFAAAEPASTTHSFTSGDYRVRFQSGELLALQRL